MIPEWIKMYLHYEYLLNFLIVSRQIHTLMENHTMTSDSIDYINSIKSDQTLIDKIKKDIQNFRAAWIQELTVLEQFILYKYLDILEKFTRLKEQIQVRYLMYNKAEEIKKLENFSQNDKILKDSLFLFYTEVDQFQLYCEQNLQSIQNILRCYSISMTPVNKLAKIDNYKIVFQSLNEMIPLTAQLKQKIEKHLLNMYFIHNIQLGKDKLMNSTVDREQRINQYQLGLFVGIFTSIFCFLMCLRYEGYLDQDNGTVISDLFPCFRGAALILVYYWYLSLDIYGWNYFQINYRLYLGFGHHYSTLQQIIRRAIYLSLIFIVAFMIYVIQSEQILQSYETIPTKWLPAIVWGTLIFYFFIPTKHRLNGMGRRWMFRMFRDSIKAIWSNPETKFVLLMDQIISLAIPLRDLEYTICYYINYFQHEEGEDEQCFNLRISQLLIVLIPQSIQALIILNKGLKTNKFANSTEMWWHFRILFSMLVTIFSFLSIIDESFIYPWIIVVMISSLWNFWWDLNREWMLFEERDNKKSLRNDLGYNKKWIYYTLISFNFILRLSWVLSISPSIYEYVNIHSQLFIFLIGFLEVTRRLIANFMRIEKEYILNRRQLKTIQAIQYPFELSEIQDNQALPRLSRKSQSNLPRQSTEYFRLSKLKEQFDDHLLYTKDQAFRNFKVDNYLDILRHKSIDHRLLEQAKEQYRIKLIKLKSLKEENTYCLQYLKQFD